jgi:hypothetical protein
LQEKGINMSLVLDGTAGITFNNATTQASAGQVLQVVSANYSTSTSTTSGSFVDTGLTIAITPKFSTSKILAIACISAVYKNGANSSVGLNIVRGSTEIVKFADNGLSYTAGSGASQVQSFNIDPCGNSSKTNNLSGSWKSMNGSTGSAPGWTNLFVRVS